MNDQRTPSFSPASVRLVVFLLLLLTIFACKSSHRPVRAIWIWETSTYRMLSDAGFRAESITFLKSRAINTVYLYADSFQKQDLLVTDPATYAALIRELHQRGFQVHALLGSAYLQTQQYVLPEKQAQAEEMISKVFAYNRGWPKTDRFDGVHVDIEPYLLPGWSTNKVRLATRYLALAQIFLDQREKYDSAIPIGAAVPFWYDSIKDMVWQGQNRPLNEHVQNLYDYIAIMDYRDKAEGRDGIIRHAENELTYAATIGRSVIIGVETGPNKLDKVTFFEEGAEHMERELRIASEQVKKYSSWSGFAIHDFDRLRTLRE